MVTIVQRTTENPVMSFVKVLPRSILLHGHSMFVERVVEVQWESHVNMSRTFILVPNPNDHTPGNLRHLRLPEPTVIFKTG